MEDVHFFHQRKYQKAEAIRELPLKQRVQMIMSIILTIVPKTLYITLMAFISMLRLIFYLIVPKKMINLRNELAVVSKISEEF